MKHARKDYDRIQDPENKIPENEPVFLLRGQDPLAPRLLMLWASELVERGGDIKMAKMTVEQAMKMIKWQQEHETKPLPDL